MIAVCNVASSWHSAMTDEMALVKHETHMERFSVRSGCQNEFAKIGQKK